MALWGLLALSKQAFLLIFSYLTVDQAQGAAWIEQHEILFQCLALVLLNMVLFALYRNSTTSESPLPLRDFLRRLLSGRFILETFQSAALQAFMLSGALVALALFLGIARVERVVFDWAGLLWLLPSVLFEALLLFIWLVGLEWLRENFRRLLLSGDRAESLSYRLFILGTEAALYYSLFSDRFEWSPSYTFYLLWAAVLSATSWLSFEASREKSFFSRRQGRLHRIFFAWGIGFSLLNVFGQKFGELKGTSFLRLFQGPLLEMRFGDLGSPLMLQAYFTLGFVALSCFLLRKVIVRSTF